MSCNTAEQASSLEEKYHYTDPLPLCKNQSSSKIYISYMPVHKKNLQQIHEGIDPCSSNRWYMLNLRDSYSFFNTTIMLFPFLLIFDHAESQRLNLRSIGIYSNIYLKWKEKKTAEPLMNSDWVTVTKYQTFK